MKARILVVDDEPRMQRVLEIALRRQGHDVLAAADGREALEVLERAEVDLVVTDLSMPGMDGLALLRAMRAGGRMTPAIVVTAYGSIDSAVEAMKLGASDYLLRPFEIEAIELAVARALQSARLGEENRYLREESDREWHELVGEGPALRTLLDLVARVGPTPSTVLVWGETGTGKELVARALHGASGREGLFVPVNCAAIPADMLEAELFGFVRGAFTGAVRDRRGRIELADRGTLFLDEIAEMPVSLQPKLLRVLEEGCIERLGSNRRIPVDMRVVAATNRDPAEAVRDGRLREDLYYRLKVVTLHVPPLRDRPEDIEPLARHFLARHAARLGRLAPLLGPAALARLRRYAFPGNVRELANMMERAVVLHAGAVLEPGHLPPEVAQAQPDGTAAEPPEAGTLPESVRALERRLIAAALERHGGRKAPAARALGISERTLWYKLRKYALR